MLTNGNELLSRYLPGILQRNPGLAGKISAAANPAAAALAAVKNSDEYAYDLKAEASEAARTSARMGDWFKTAPLSDFSAYVEKVKNGTAEDYAPWNDSAGSGLSPNGFSGSGYFPDRQSGPGSSVSSGPPNYLDTNPAGSMLPGTTMDIFGRPIVESALPGEQKGDSLLLAGMLSDGTIYSVPPSPQTVLEHAKGVTDQMTKDGLRSDFFWENGWHSRTYGGDYLSCGDQVDYLKPFMEKQYPDWKFEVDAGPLHTVLIGIPPGGQGARLRIDPWYGSFTTMPE